MKIRTASLLASVFSISVAALLLAGCGSGTSSTAQEDKAFKDHDGKATAPTADQLKPTGKAFIGEPTGSSVGGPAGTPPPGAIPSAGGGK